MHELETGLAYYGVVVVAFHAPENFRCIFHSKLDVLHTTFTYKQHLCLHCIWYDVFLVKWLLLSMWITCMYKSVHFLPLMQIHQMCLERWKICMQYFSHIKQKELLLQRELIIVSAQFAEIFWFFTCWISYIAWHSLVFIKRVGNIVKLNARNNIRPPG